MTVSQEAKLVNFDTVNPWWIGNGGRRRVCPFCLLEGRECVMCQRVGGDSMEQSIVYIVCVFDLVRWLHCSISVAQWSAHQTVIAKVPVRSPGGQSIHTKILMVLWTSCIYKVWVALGIMLVGGRVPMACSKVFLGPAGVRPNTFGRRNNCL